MTAIDTDRLTPRRGEIVAAAMTLLEREGESALTMRRLAGSLGIKAPSLYKHFSDKEGLELELVIAGFEEAASRFEEAVRRRPRRPLTALAKSYRAFAHDHPHLYRLMNDRPLPRERMPEGLEQRAATPFLQATGSHDLARATWAMAHGLVMLELNGRFPADADLDAAWLAGVAAMERFCGV